MNAPLRLLVPLLLLPLVVWPIASSAVQDPPPIEIPEDPGPARATEPSSEAPEVAIELRRLHEEVGTWRADMQLFRAPGMPPVTATGREVNRLLGETWLLSDFTASPMGQPFAGHGQTSFDVARGVAIGTWVDTTRPELRVMEGSYDLQRRERSFTYTEAGPEGELQHYRSRTRTLDAEHRSYDVVRLGDDGEETPVLHISYTLESR